MTSPSTLLLVLVLTLQALPALAAPRDLKARYEAVKADLKAGRDAEALASCEQALSEQPADAELRWGFLIGAGLAAEKLGRPEAALGFLERFLADHEDRRRTAGADWEARRQGVQARADRLEQALLGERARVTFESSPAGARVTLDGQAPRGADTATTPLRLFLEPGPHQLHLEREGFQPVDLAVTVVRGRRDTVHVPLVAVQRPAPAPVVTPLPTAPAAPPIQALAPAPPAAAPRASAVPLAATAPAPALRPLWGWLAVGGGAALLLAGIPFTVLAVDDADAMGSIDPRLGSEAGSKRYRELESSLETNQAIAWVLYGLGAAIVAGGATYLVVFADGDPPSSAGGARLQPGLAPLDGGAALTLGGRW